MSGVNLNMTAAGDLAVTSDGRGLTWTTGVEAIAQLAEAKIRLIAGEWQLDTAEGLDWDLLFGGGTTKSQVHGEMRRVLLTVPGIARVVSVDVVTASDRIATVTWVAQGDTGALLDGVVGV